MKNGWRTGFGLSAILAGAICLSGCAGSPTVAPSYANTAPATAVYMISHVDTAITECSAVPANDGSLIRTITYLPSYYGGPLATDSAGQIYVAVASDPIDRLNPGEISIYPPNSAGGATPSRTININSDEVCTLAVDPAGLLYVAINTGSAEDAPPRMVSVYSATASGTTTPLRTLQLTNVFPTGVSDIAADATGNIYVAGYRRTGNGGVIAVYPPAANGPSTPIRTITLTNSDVYGVAVDPEGNIFANVCPGCYSSSGAGFVIEEFAPGETGEATPINTINLSVGAPWKIALGGPVRLDGAGNIFTSLVLSSTDTPEPNFVVYGFGSADKGNAAPTVQIAPTNGYSSYFAVN
jgi:hypothetical protein